MPLQTFFNKIVDQVHKDGGRFTFDIDCMVINCKALSEWEQPIIHPTQGKITMHLCEKHMNDYDKNKSFSISLLSHKVKKGIRK